MSSPLSPQDSDGPLAGVVVIDLSRAVAGPHAAMMLGDLGAQVIKVEAPGSPPVLDADAARTRRWLLDQQARQAQQDQQDQQDMV